MRRFAVVVMLFGLFAIGCAEETPEASAPTEAPTEAPSGSDTTAADPAGGTSLAQSCVETYSIENLKKREFAFDGTVTSISPDAADGADTVVFDVEAWFKGGEGSTATRKGSFSGMTSAGGDERKVGDRLLVAGDDDFAWDCGFTQPYDADVAADWDAAL